MQGGVRFKRSAVALKSSGSVGNDGRTKLRHTLPAAKFEPKRSLPRQFITRYATYKKKRNPKNIDFEFCKVGLVFFRELETMKSWLDDTVSCLNSFYYSYVHTVINLKLFRNLFLWLKIHFLLYSACFWDSVSYFSKEAFDIFISFNMFWMKWLKACYV